MDQATIRRRLQTLRERRNLSQGDLSRSLGFNDRQTLSDIELGKRNVSPGEIARAAQVFGVDVGYFTDPLELAGEARFSWRQSAGNGEDLESFERHAGRWIATYRHLSRLRGAPVNSSFTRVGLTSKSSFEEAMDEGDAVSRALELGGVPALTLAGVLEEKHDTLVLLADMISGISGAACQLGPLNTIIINRREVEGRRAFDMAHEVFHLATWHEMPPRHVEGADDPPRYRRIEQLADNFASGLLMPRHAVANWIEHVPMPGKETGLAAWIRHGASHFHVSGQAFKWRLVGLGTVKRAAAARIDDAAIRVEGREGASLPPRFSRKFMETLAWGIDEGHLSVRRAAEVLGTTVDDFADIFAEHGLKTPFDL